jgi:DNA-binding PadR family transcriptional regulator
MNDLILLANLLDGPKHGYELKRVAGLIFGTPELHNNFVYPMLHRFQKSGWVSRTSTAGKRGQTRFQYALTRKGKQELLRRAAEYPDGKDGTHEGFYVRVALLPLLGLEARLKILQAEESELEALLERFARIQRTIDAPFFGLRVIRFLERRTRMELAWVRELRRQVLYEFPQDAAGGLE